MLCAASYPLSWERRKLMSTQTMTQKQRVALEAREAAQRDGKTLSDYAKERGLVIRELYNAPACQQRRAARLPDVPVRTPATSQNR
jgi:hypothetical protein